MAIQPLNENSFAKPIFVMAFPEDFPNDIFSIMDGQQKRMPDYHVFCIKMKTDHIRFKVYNASNAHNMEIEKIKEEILKQVG